MREQRRLWDHLQASSAVVRLPDGVLCLDANGAVSLQRQRGWRQSCWRPHIRSRRKFVRRDERRRQRRLPLSAKRCLRRRLPFEFCRLAERPLSNAGRIRWNLSGSRRFLDTSGNLLGTTSAGGTSDLGTIFRLTHSGGNWTPSSVYQFQSGAGGQLPWAGLVGDSSGNFFGATTAGGANGGGTVYQLSPSGGGWTYSSIYTFAAGGGPVSNLTIDSSGNLYGTTPGGGAFGHEQFSLTHSGSAWIYASLHDFTGGSDGAQPSGSVVLDANGSVYGTAYGGGSSNCPGGCGVAWSVSQGLAITTTSLPAGAVGQQYQAQLAASGGQPPYTWSLTSGSLPTGLNLSTSGLISGIPSGQGAFTFTVQVRDQLSNRAGKNFSITISSSNLAITTTQLPSGTQGTFYNTALSASGGTPPYSWSIVSGALPAGLSLVSSTGVIQGTPTTPGSRPSQCKCETRRPIRRERRCRSQSLLE